MDVIFLVMHAVTIETVPFFCRPPSPRTLPPSCSCRADRQGQARAQVRQEEARYPPSRKSQARGTFRAPAQPGQEVGDGLYRPLLNTLFPAVRSWTDLGASTLVSHLSPRRRRDPFGGRWDRERGGADGASASRSVRCGHSARVLRGFD